MPKPKGAGDLRHRVKFQRRAVGDDGYGNPLEGWVDLDIVRSASLTPTRGGEDVQADRLNGQASWDCWVRNDSGTRAIVTGDRALDCAVVEIAAAEAAKREAAEDTKVDDNVVLFAKGHTITEGDVVALEAAGVAFVKVRSHRPFNICFIGDMDGDRVWLLMQLESGVVSG